MARLDPHSYADLTQGVTASVTLRLRADFDARRLEGSAALTFRAPLPGGPLDLDSRGLEIESVEADGRHLPFEIAPPEKILGSRLRIQTTAGLTRIEVRYRTAPNASALQWLEPAQTSSKTHPYLFSQCQAIHARSIAPLQDTPRVRIRYSAEIDAPSELTVLMSAASLAPGAISAGGPRSRTVHRFEMPQPIPPYLLAITIGRLASKDVSARSRVWAEPDVVEKAAWEFADVEKMIVAAEALFGPYDWDRFDVLVMPPSFPYGGMENPRLTFVTPTLIAGDRSLVDVIAHELAHSWTGNLVTNADANHFWLNEGFTVYAERRIVEALYGAERAALLAAVGRIELDHDVERFGKTSPLTRLQTELTGMDPDDVFSLIPYEKGYLFLVLLERAAGRAKFDVFLQHWLSAHRFGSVTTGDFEKAMEEELPGLLARVDASRWLHGPGVPADAPAFAAPRLEQVRALAAGWKDGKRPARESATGWTANEWHLYLRAIPPTLDLESMAALDAEWHLTKSGNMEVLVSWLTLAAASDYKPAFPRIREVLHSVGRMRYLKPLYRALMSKPANTAFAREVFASAEKGYHAIAAQGCRAIVQGT